MPPKKRTGQKLLRFDRRLGVRFVAGADEAGRGPLAGPLVVAGVLLDYECLRDHRVRPLALLNDSKQVDAATREELYRAVLACAERVSVHVFPPAVIDRDGLHSRTCAACARRSGRASPPTSRLVDGFKLGPTAPPHRAVVDGDTKSAAIAAASIVAKVTRDRYMRTADALYPAYGFASHVGYITPSHTRGRPRATARARSTAARSGALLPPTTLETRSKPKSLGTPSERRAARWYRLRGYRILATNVWLAGDELDVVARRGRTVVFCEVKSKTRRRLRRPARDGDARRRCGGCGGRPRPGCARTRSSRRSASAST